MDTQRSRNMIYGSKKKKSPIIETEPETAAMFE